MECALAVGQKDVQAAADIVTNSPQLLDRLHHTSEKTVAPMVYKLTAMVAKPAFGQPSGSSIRAPNTSIGLALKVSA